MFSLLQNIQRTVGKAASEIPAPSILELSVQRLSEPTVGYLPKGDFEMQPADKEPLARRGRIWDLQLLEFAFVEPPQRRVELPERADVLECVLGVAARCVDLAYSDWRFQIETIAQSSWPLLGQSDTQALLTELQSSTAPNRLHLLTKPQGVSQNLNRLLNTSSRPRTEDCLALLLAQFVVSQDLHKPLARSARSDGKRYSAETYIQEETLGSESLQTPPLAFAGDRLGNRKTFKQTRRGGNQRVTRGMSIWDLLLPLLQGPVNLDLGTVLDLPSNLYAFQIKGVEFLVETAAALLGDDMGTGKTVQTSVALRILFQNARIRTALIVCPLSVIPNWDRELAKWARNLAVTVVRGNKDHREICWRQSAHVWLTTYETLRNDIETVLTLRKGGFDLIVLDEAQRIKNWSAGTTRAVRQLRATYRWGLSGTPLENNTDELWTILNVLKPEISKGPLDWSQGIQSVLRPIFLRRRKQDVLTDLPPLVQNPVWLRLEYEQRKSYDQLEEQGVLELHAKGETITAQSIIVLLNKLKQVCNRCPRSGESSKLVWLLDSLHDIAAQGDKVLVFSQYKDERFAGSDWLEKELANFGALNYSNATSDQKRKEILAAFRDKVEHRVFVGHPKTAGLGLNELVAANYVVHFDHWWNPAVMNQATARAHRPGQTKTVFAYDLWIEDTYEEIIFKLLGNKQGLYDEIIDSMSAQRDQSENLLFAVADTLFTKFGLEPPQRKPDGDSKNK
jgi:superfamily II DNA or RNA helicase